MNAGEFFYADMIWFHHVLSARPEGAVNTL
jgi:hypothetical protein